MYNLYIIFCILYIKIPIKRTTYLCLLKSTLKENNIYLKYDIDTQPLSLMEKYTNI